MGGWQGVQVVHVPCGRSDEDVMFLLFCTWSSLFVLSWLTRDLSGATCLQPPVTSMSTCLRPPVLQLQASSLVSDSQCYSYRHAHLCPAPNVTVTGMPTTCFFLCGCWDSNSILHVCRTSALTYRAISQPLKLISNSFYLNVYEKIFQCDSNIWNMILFLTISLKSLE